MEISFFDVTNNKEKEYFRKKLKGHSLKFFAKSIQNIPTREYKNSQIIVIFIHSQISEQIIDKLPKLKLILTKSTGFDHINIKYAHSKNISVANVPSYGENTVAEHTFALILNLSRKVHKSYRRTLNNNYSIEGLQGFDLKDKTLGIIGVGHIGMHIIRIAKGFGMHVKAYDINKNKFISEILHFEYTSLEDVLKNSDILSLHMPLNKNTYHFLDETKLRQTKKGVYIINTSRGDLINTDALYKYLKNKHIAGAGLDVIEGEEFISNEEELIGNPQAYEKISQLLLDKKIFQMENVIFTPHNAFNSTEAINRIFEITYENILSYLENKLQNQVNNS